MLKRTHEDRIVPLDNKVSCGQRFMAELGMNAYQSGLIRRCKNVFQGELKVRTRGHRKCSARSNKVTERILPKVLPQRFKRQRRLQILLFLAHAMYANPPG